MWPAHTGEGFSGEGGNRKMAASCESPFSQFSFAPSPEQVVQCVWGKKPFVPLLWGQKWLVGGILAFQVFSLKIPFFKAFFNPHHPHPYYCCTDLRRFWYFKCISNVCLQLGVWVPNVQSINVDKDFKSFGKSLNDKTLFFEHQRYFLQFAFTVSYSHCDCHCHWHVFTSLFVYLCWSGVGCDNWGHGKICLLSSCQMIAYASACVCGTYQAE